MPDRPPAGPDDLPPLDDNIKFISRADWGSEKFEEEKSEEDEEDDEYEEDEEEEEVDNTKTDTRKAMKFPLDFVRYTTTGGRICNSTKQCKMMLRKLQKKSREEDSLYDVPYNFLVDEEGYIYEGRGWFLEPQRPEQYKYLKGKAIDIAYFGDYGKHSGKPTLNATRAAESLVQYGVDAGMIKVGRKEIGYNN